MQTGLHLWVCSIVCRFPRPVVPVCLGAAKCLFMPRQVAWDTLDADWSASLGVQYRVQVSPPGGPGLPGRCEVSFHAPTLFNGLLGLSQGEWGHEWFVSRSETWKARWR